MKIKISIKRYSKFKDWNRLAENYKKQYNFLKKRLETRANANLQNEITKRNLSSKSNKQRNSLNYTSPGSLKANTYAKSVKDGIYLHADVPYASYIEKGIKKHVMKYLGKAAKPIPLTDKNTGKLIFRWAKTRSVVNGRQTWEHPGFSRGKGFFKSAVNKTLSEAITEIQKLNRITANRWKTR